MIASHNGSQSLSDIQYTSCAVAQGTTSLLSLGSGVIRQWWVVLLHLGTPRGNPPGVAVYVCELCVSLQKGKNATIEHPAIAPAILSPAPPPLPVLACTLTYSWSRFGDTKIKAFLCFSAFLFLLCHQRAECCSLGRRHRELIQTDTITFHFCFVIIQSSECLSAICQPYCQQHCTGGLKMLCHFIYYSCALTTETRKPSRCTFYAKALTSSHKSDNSDKPAEVKQFYTAAADTQPVTAILYCQIIRFKCSKDKTN